MRGVFVTGTDTGVGKTVLAASIAAALLARGERVAAFKPVVTGVDEDGTADHALLAGVTGQSPAAVSPLTFGPPASPHLAAWCAGVVLDPDALLAAASAAADGAQALVCEGVGGLLVPLTEAFSILDFATALGLPVVIAARPGLGTINHSLLTIAAARAAGLDVRGVVLTPWPAAPCAIERSNSRTIAAIGAITVTTLPALPALTTRALAAAGAALPLDDWLA